MFDPATDSFRQVPLGIDAARGVQAALPDGRVLVVGLGESGHEVVVRAVALDPRTDQVQPIAPPLGTSAGSLTPLPDGRVLLTGRSQRDIPAKAEIYDPAADRWTAVAGLDNPSGDVVTLPDGRIAFLSMAESWLFDPATERFSLEAGTDLGYTAGPVLLDDGTAIAIDDQGRVRFVRLPSGSA